jgi:selenide,water dikinase
LNGGRAICKEANIPLAGGHTIDSNDPIFGLAVTGTVEKKHIKTNNTAQESDLLFLSKPIGTGILSTALKRELLQPEHYKFFVEQMTSLNKIGAELGKIDSVHAMTDITGFGLLGHLIEIAEASNISVELYYNHIKRMEGVDDYLKQRIVPDATYRNWNSYNNKVQFDKGVNVMEAFNLLPDPQTNGGLLISINEEAIEEVKEVFSEFGLNEFLEPVGRCVDKKEKTVYVTTF